MVVEGRDFMGGIGLERQVLELEVRVVEQSHYPLEHPGEIIRE